MTAVIWNIYWLDAQGYDVFDNILCQYNKSANILGNNGKASIIKRKKHMNIRYYFVTDRIEEYEISLEWCPTEDIIVDFMTKPTQGEAFKRFRDQLMGVTEAQDLGPGKPQKDFKYQVSKYGKKVDRNTALDHISVLECVS